jgi:hypothetical protein
MPEEIITAQTTENSGVDSHADIDTRKDSVNDADFTDADNPSDEGSDKSDSKVQSKAQNSENARRRREAERQAEIKKAETAAREKAIIETLNGKNPYTGEEMKDSTDVEEYLLMRDIEKDGGDPLADFSKHHKKRSREEAERIAKEEQQQEWYRKDRDDFAAKHPDVDLQSLIQDELFQKFASGKVGELPLSDIYEGFMDLVSVYEKRAKRKAEQLLANSKASPGSLSTTNPSGNGFFTREQVCNMSRDEVHKNYDKIRESMSKWSH